MGVFVYIVTLQNMNNIVIILVSVVIGIISYFSLLLILKEEYTQAGLKLIKKRKID